MTVRYNPETDWDVPDVVSFPVTPQRGGMSLSAVLRELFSAPASTHCLMCGETEKTHRGSARTCPPDFDPQYGTWTPNIPANRQRHGLT